MLYLIFEVVTFDLCYRVCVVSGVCRIFQTGKGVGDNLEKKETKRFFGFTKCILRPRAQITYNFLPKITSQRGGGIALIVRKIKKGGDHLPILPAVNTLLCVVTQCFSTSLLWRTGAIFIWCSRNGSRLFDMLYYDDTLQENVIYSVLVVGKLFPVHNQATSKIIRPNNYNIFC